MKEYYEILGLEEGATKEEVEKAYKKLYDKYSSEIYAEGEKGNQAAKNLTKIKSAYNEIMDSFNEYKEETSKTDFSVVIDLLKQGDFNKAQEILDNFTDRNAEWHYYQSVIFYKKKWVNESKKQLEIAIELDPDNAKYKEEYEKLKQSVEFHNRRFNSSNPYGASPEGDYNRQMGGNSCATFVDCCFTWLCVNLACNMCCR